MYCKARFEVLVALREKIESLGKCSCVHLHLKGFPSIIYVYILPLGRFDVVLGVQWLHSLKEIK